MNYRLVVMTICIFFISCASADEMSAVELLRDALNGTSEIKLDAGPRSPDVSGGRTERKPESTTVRTFAVIQDWSISEAVSACLNGAKGGQKMSVDIFCANNSDGEIDSRVMRFSDFAWRQFVNRKKSLKNEGAYVDIPHKGAAMFFKRRASHSGDNVLLANVSFELSPEMRTAGISTDRLYKQFADDLGLLELDDTPEFWVSLLDKRQKIITAKKSKQEADALLKLEQEQKNKDANPILYGVLDILHSDKSLSVEEAKALAEKHMMRCRNVKLAGPIAASFPEIHFLTQSNKKIVAEKSPATRTLSKHIQDAVNDGLSCRPASPFGWSCTGMAYLTSGIGEQARPLLSNYRKYGEIYGDYVAVQISIKFRDGKSEVVPVFVERKNVACTGRQDDVGMHSKSKWSLELR